MTQVSRVRLEVSLKKTLDCGPVTNIEKVHRNFFLRIKDKTPGPVR